MGKKHGSQDVAFICIYTCTFFLLTLFSFRFLHSYELKLEARLGKEAQMYMQVNAILAIKTRFIRLYMIYSEKSFSIRILGRGFWTQLQQESCVSTAKLKRALRLCIYTRLLSQGIFISLSLFYDLKINNRNVKTRWFFQWD